MTLSVSWTVSRSKRGTLAGVEVAVTVSAAGATDVMMERLEPCTLARAAQAIARTNSFDMLEVLLLCQMCEGVRSEHAAHKADAACEAFKDRHGAADDSARADISSLLCTAVAMEDV